MSYGADCEACCSEAAKVIGVDGEQSKAVANLIRSKRLRSLPPVPLFGAAASAAADAFTAAAAAASGAPAAGADVIEVE